MDNTNLKEVVGKFAILGTISSVNPLGHGLINDSYFVKTEEVMAPDYLLQRINNQIFTDVDTLMDNIIAVSKHLEKKYIEENVPDIHSRHLTFIKCKTNDKYYYQDENDNYWRVMLHIKSETKEEVTPETSYDVGRSFGKFQAMLADIPVELKESIPNFHNMEYRLQQLQDAIKENKAGRVEKVSSLIEGILSNAEDMCLGERLHREGKLPKRICHCDTKVSNLLFDSEGKVLCVIDLDTVMPNFVFSDIGDFLRSAANTSVEDEPDLDKVNFNLDIFHSFIKGYLESASGFLLPVEVANIPYATQLFPYMQAVRFLTDYLNGDTYYKIKYPEHNLVRTWNQFKLFNSVKAHTVHMQSFIKECMEEGCSK